MKKSDHERILREALALQHDTANYRPEDRSALVLRALLGVQRDTDPTAQTDLGRWIRTLDDLHLIRADNFRPFGIERLTEMSTS